MSNMDLWDSVCKTDPAMTRRVSQKGGFTAIDAQYQLKNATERWGPYGKAWGVKECVYSYVNDFGDNSGSISEVSLEAIFYYPSGDFEISTDIAYRKGGDSRKKLLTDLTTKALSKLGFNADVFEGKFNDNKYVAEMKKEFSKKKKIVDETPVDIDKIKRMGGVAGTLYTKMRNKIIEDAYSNQDIPDDILDVVKENIDIGTKRLTKEVYQIWHSRVLSNFFGVDSIKSLNKEDASSFIEMQNERFKMEKGD